ncbi:hypothetical protein [Halomicrobium sp. LC1Hm]|uniref:hypothetical protein n=1 Tax=Halomicrobium sp. LC1Hm TaxID=2610902 RepID=UPI0012983384|nr:hypothetical protein [Halomicrobium sp. LC1Hm]QGA83272.1 hypothetical protein LC1Hm_2237 [Halomicrobium sp. LC1Hm]
MVETRRLVAVFLIGLLVGVAATTAVSLGFQQSLSVSVPSASVSGNCNSTADVSGWAAQVPNRGHQTILLNQTISGPVESSSLEGDIDFRLTIDTNSSASDCRYEAVLTLPDNFDSLTVLHDERAVLRIQNRGDGTSRFWRLNESAP